MAISGEGALGGAASGAAAGAAIGGPYGAVIGGVVGGIGGLFSGAGQPKYDPYTLALQGQSYDLFQQGANLMYPAESQLVQYATDVNAPTEAANRAVGNVQQQFGQQAAARQRLYSLLGVNPTVSQQQSVEKQGALGQAQAEAQAANAARQGTIGLQQQILR